MKNFGQWLRAHRKARDLTQGELGRKAGISTSYVSTLERAEPHHLTNAPPQPAADVVERIARALNVDIDEARTAAGYAPHNPAVYRPPRTVPELLERLGELGVEPMFFGGVESLPDDPAMLADILDDFATVVTLRLRKRKPHDPTSGSGLLLE